MHRCDADADAQALACGHLFQGGRFLF